MATRQVIDATDLVPAIPPPPGVLPNLAHPPNRQWATIFALVLYIATTTLFLTVRMYTRIKVHAKLWWDDYSMVLGWVGLLATAGLVFETLKFGGATDEWNVSKPHAAQFKEIFSKLEISARLGIFFTKTSILLLYIRYFCPPAVKRSVIWWSTWAVIIFNLLYCIALILTVTLQCVGKHREPGQSCINSWAVLISASIINVITDLIMLAIPICAVWNLRLARTRKLGLWIMFSFAGLAVAASVARLAYQAPQAKSPNQTSLLNVVAILALAEHAIGIIVGSMPLLPSFYSHIRKHFRSMFADGGPSDGDTKYPIPPVQRKIRGKYNDTTLLATEIIDDDTETIRHRDSDQNRHLGSFTAAGTDDLPPVNERSHEPRVPPKAQLQNKRDSEWSIVEGRVTACKAGPGDSVAVSRPGRCKSHRSVKLRMRTT